MISGNAFLGVQKAQSSETEGLCGLVALFQKFNHQLNHSKNGSIAV
jgi:hypothetical protein